MELTSTIGEIVMSNYPELSGRMLNLLLTKEMCDVQLQVGSHTFDAHKLILCSCSDVFKTMLTNQKWSEANKPAVILVEEPLCETVFGRFIHYIYSGQLYLSHITVGPLLTLADKYNVKDMVELCRSYMHKHLDAPVAVSCVLQWWQIAIMRNDSELADAILSYIECNFDKVISNPDFTNANLDIVEKLFASSRLVIHYEALIFFSVVMWLKDYLDLRHPSEDETKDAFKRLIRLVRWPMMNKDEVAWLRDCNEVHEFLVMSKSYMSSEDIPPDLDPYLLLMPSKDNSIISKSGACQYGVCNNILGCSNDEPYTFLPLEDSQCCDSRSNFDKDKCGLKRKKMTEKIKNRAFRPRVYFSDYWCTKLTVSNFLAFPQYATQTFFFSTPKTGDRQDIGNTLLDWEVELSPKGVRFPPAVLIGLEQDGSKLIEESYIPTCRLSVISRSPQELPLKVQVNILVQANSPANPGSYYFENCQRHMCIFDGNSQRHNFDDIVPYENFTSYLHPEGPISDLYPTRTLAFTLFIVIRPLT
uniref:BTB domain-containing protein n=1 Tax=Biomphalaria glabrata TaxID=6526 RepID=A0A2C9KSD9_BIOGL